MCLYVFNLFIEYRHNIHNSQEAYNKLGIQQTAMKWGNLVIYMNS